MDQIEQRLRETSEKCYNCYEAWQQNKKDSGMREALREAIHELRKVSSRLEIELAVSERDEMAQKPIPIPPHRDAKRRNHDNYDDDTQPDFGNDDGDHAQPRQNHGGGGGGGGGGQRRRPYPSKRPASGGGGGGNNGGN